MLLTAAALPSRAQDFHKVVTITTPVRIQRVSACGATGLVAGLASTGSVYAWRLPTGELVSTGHGEEGISAFACSPDGKWLALGKREGVVIITDISGTSAKTLTVAKRRVDDLVFSPDGSLLAVRTNEAPVQLWNPAQGTRVAVLKTDFSGSTGMGFSTDSAMFATADSDTSISIYDRQGTLKARYADLLLEPFAVSFLPSGTQVAIGGADGIVSILDASNAHVVRQFPKQPDPVVEVAALPDGLSVLSIHLDAARMEKLTSVLWEVRTGERRELTAPFDAAPAHVVGATTVGRQWVVFTADSDSSLTAWMFANQP